MVGDYPFRMYIGLSFVTINRSFERNMCEFKEVFGQEN